MKMLIEKAVRTALLLAVPVTFFIVGYLLYNQQVNGPSAENLILYDNASLRKNDSVTFFRMRASIDRELDSIARLPAENVLGFSDNDHPFDTSANTSSTASRSPGFSTQNAVTAMPGNEALQGPSALFTRTYSLAIGKPVPVSVLWTSDSVALPVKRELVTIMLNDVADDKAGFTLTDPSDVLFYSQANYAAHDKISIEDDNCNLHISVLEVQPDAVKIELTAYLDDNIVRRLKAME